MFHRWLQLGGEGRQLVWRLYGWFSALMMCGSCVGAVTWAAWMQRIVGQFTAGANPSTLSLSQRYLMFSVSTRWEVVFRVTYPIEFLCLSVAKLMVLDRLSDFAAAGGETKRWVMGGRIVMAAVVLGNTVGLAANIAAAVYYQKTAETVSAASGFFAANSTALGLEYQLSGTTLNKLAHSIASVQSFFEVAVLLLIVAAFLAVGIACARRVSSRLLALSADSAAMADTRTLRLQIVVVTGFIFATFLLRSVVSTMLAVASQLQDSDNVCPGHLTDFSRYCKSCYNVFTHVWLWNTFTPEFLPVVVLISSPLALLVALWGMTSKLTLQLMRSRKRGSSLTRAIMTRHNSC
jgi:hypothetical protein